MRLTFIGGMIALFLLAGAFSAYATNGCFGTDPECGSVPTDNCDVRQNTSFTPGTYSLPNGIDICANNIVLDCNGASMSGPGSTGTGVSVLNANGTSISNCDVSNYSVGINLSSANSNALISNTANSNYYGIQLHPFSSSNTLSNNTANSNSWAGIIVSSSSSNSLTSNTASSNSWYGIYLFSSSNNTLSHNTADSTSYGYGISLYSSSNSNTLSSSTANSNFNGIVVSSSSNNTLTQNTANSNTNNGIIVSSSSNSNTLTQNTANSNTNNGIIVSFPSNSNTLTQNTLNSNSNYGIYLSSSNNLLYRNNLITNTWQAFDNGNNTWFYKKSGNYWSDYDSPGEGCFDLNLDGKCDSPYVIPGAPSNKDMYPYTKQNGWLCPTTPIINGTFPGGSWQAKGLCAEKR